MADRNTYITDKNGVDKVYPYTWASNVFRENDPRNTVESSLSALEAQRFAIEIPLQASSWTGDAAPYQYRVNLTDMTDTQMPDMFLVAAGEDFTQDELDTYELLDNPQTYNGYLIIPTKAGAAKPSKDITVRLEGLTVPGDTSAAGVAALQADVTELGEKIALSVDDVTWKESLTVDGFTGVRSNGSISFSTKVTANSELTGTSAGETVLFTVKNCKTIYNLACFAYEATSPYTLITTGFSILSNGAGAGRLYGTIPNGKSFYINVMFPLRN